MTIESPLRILLLEDNPNDAELIGELLEGDRLVCKITRVQTRSEFQTALESHPLHLILADYKLPSFDGLSALKLAQSARPDVPFIFVSGSLGEEVAIEALKIGATDYVLKSRLSRLAPSVRRARREAEERAERQNAEEALRQSERELRQVIETIPANVWSTSPDGAVDFVNQRWQELTALPRERALGWSWEEVVHPDDRTAFVARWRRALETGQSMESEVRVRRGNGEYRWFFIRNVPLRDEQSKILRWYGTSIDIQDRKQAEQALRRSQSYLAEAQRLTHTGSWASKVDGSLYWSEENFRIWGFDPRQGAPNRETLLQRIHPEDRDRVQEQAVKAVREGRDYNQEFRIVLPDGTVRLLQAVAHPVYGASGELLEVIGTHVDVTDRKHAEEERDRLRQLEADLAHINRVSMMGELAASLAHEIKQPISATMTNARTSLRWLAGDPPNLQEARDAIMSIVKDAARAIEVIDHLRCLYKKDVPTQRELVDVNEVAREMLVLLHSEAARYSISMRTELANELPKIKADRVQLQQVFMNLMLNAIEAMGDTSGELTIKSDRTENGQVLVSIRDTGVGLPTEKVDQIFSAFFTTKSQGTGMGLSISRTIVESHGGRLWATTNSGQGATFHFTLPTEMKAYSTPAA